jgi:two-component system, cell cycle response regulator
MPTTPTPKREQPSSDPRPCVLIVEDSKTARAMLQKDLGEQYLLLHVIDGAEAWAQLQANPDIDLVITDINMPHMSGQQLLVKIRTSDAPHIRNLPVIVMTGTDGNADKNLAFLNGANDFVNKPVDGLEIQARVNVHYKLANTIRELEKNKKALAHQATTDPLTGLKNRRSFHEQGEVILLAAGNGADFSIIQLDIDHFKQVNDVHGHAAGDEVLVAVAKLLSQVVRATDTSGRGGDILARIGGEEFAILLPNTNRLGAAVMAERIRTALEKLPICIGETHLKVTASLGTANFRGEKVETIRELLNIADRRMYLAKKTGRNRICVNDEGKTNYHA